MAGRIFQEEKEVRVQETFRMVELVDSINGTGFVADEKLAELDSLREKHWTGGEGELQPWMTAEEYAISPQIWLMCGSGRPLTMNCSTAAVIQTI